MTQIMPVSDYEENKKPIRVPEWLYYFSDEQFVQWCKQRKLDICSKVRAFPEDERAAIFRYMVRQSLVN
jgi:hypothetical protein